ncbi:MAG TPA: carboxypeptidase regulatory-like domain-containing protein [Vicinamibacterales bacterium]|nr:carboxypeptidase regulatory-like domain-containing protein [Vicinamibacterales bacterium]
MMRLAGMAIVALAAAAIGAGHGRAAQAQTPVRDAGVAATGGGFISGIVSTADEPARPLRYVTLTLNGAGISPPRMTSTDADGRFTFADLPAGRYMLTAARSGYVRGAYGSLRPGGSGSSIAVSASTTTSVTMRLVRSAIISGAVRMPPAAPISSIRVLPMQDAIVNGARRLMPVGGAYPVDDRGEYRMTGLPPGDYVVAVDVAVGAVSHLGDVSTPSELRSVTPEEIQWARRQLLGQPGSGPPPPPPPPQPILGFAPVYYPGVTGPAAATTVSVGAGETRHGIDIALTFTPLAEVSGVVTGPDGTRMPRAVVLAVAGDDFHSYRASSQTDDDGRFALRRLPPGQYTLTVRARPVVPESTGRGGAPARTISMITPDMTFWATLDVRVDGRDQADLAIQLQRGARVSGRLKFDGAAAQPRLSAYSVALAAPATRQAVAATFPAIVDDDGTFVINGVPPGRYRLSAGLNSGPGTNSPWHFSGVAIDTTAIADDQVDVRSSSDIDGLVVTLTDRPTEIAGRLTAATGLPAPEHFIVAFPADPALWTNQSRRILSVRPATDGEFVIRALPAGDYLLAALTDLNAFDLQDGRFLRALAAAAVPVTIAEHERKRQDLRIR